jgi:chondroitin AC lyase
MVRHYCIIILWFLFSRWYVGASTRNDDISIIHERIMELMVWPAKENISIVVQNATVFTETLNSSCYWPDVNYYDKGLDTWFTAEHVYRITTMLQAITVNGSSVKNDPKIRSAAHCALNVWLVKDWENPNWYFNEIRIPLHLTSQLLMLSDNATSFEIEKIKEISFRAAWWLNRGTDVGANLLWMIQIEIYRSLATNNITGIEQGFTRMWQDITFRPASSIGVQYDWSYHFHGRQLLSGAYGESWAADIFAFVLCSNHTQYEPDAQKLTIFANLFNER